MSAVRTAEREEANALLQTAVQLAVRGVDDADVPEHLAPGVRVRPALLEGRVVINERRDKGVAGGDGLEPGGDEGVGGHGGVAVGQLGEGGP